MTDKGRKIVEQLVAADRIVIEVDWVYQGAEFFDAQAAAALSTRYVTVTLVPEVNATSSSSSSSSWPTVQVAGTRDDVRAWLRTNWDDDPSMLDTVMDYAIRHDDDDDL